MWPQILYGLISASAQLPRAFWIISLCSNGLGVLLWLLRVLFGSSSARHARWIAEWHKLAETVLCDRWAGPSCMHYARRQGQGIAIDLSVVLSVMQHWTCHDATDPLNPGHGYQACYKSRFSLEQMQLCTFCVWVILIEKRWDMA